MRTTRKHFEVFEREVRKWVDRFHLGRWDLAIAHMECGDDEEASCHARPNLLVARITLNTTWPEDSATLTNDAVRLAGRHEVGELLLMPLTAELIVAGVGQEKIQKLTHEVIHTLEQVIG